MTDTNFSSRRWRIFQLILSSVILLLEILNIMLYDSFNPANVDAKWNYEFWALRDKNRLIITIVCLPTTIVSIILLAYVLLKGETLTRRNKLIKKAELFKNIELHYAREAELKQSNGFLNGLIVNNINSTLLFSWSLTAILSTILFFKNWDLMCSRLDEKDRIPILCNDFIINFLLNIMMFFSCIYITFMKILRLSTSDEINLKV